VRKAPPAHNTYRETSANDAKRMFVCVNLSALIRAREVKNDKASLRNATQLLCSLWDYTLGEAGTRAGDDNGRRIYYISAAPGLHFRWGFCIAAFRRVPARISAPVKTASHQPKRGSLQVEVFYTTPTRLASILDRLGRRISPQGCCISARPP
jgi:hypothetical protein